MIITIPLFGVQAWVWSFVFCQLLFGVCGFRHQSLKFRVGYGPLFGSVLYQVIRFDCKSLHTDLDVHKKRKNETHPMFPASYYYS